MMVRDDGNTGQNELQTKMAMMNGGNMHNDHVWSAANYIILAEIDDRLMTQHNVRERMWFYWQYTCMLQ